MTDWALTVGLEVHVELKTKTKMFCGCANDPFNSKPNVNVCPVCYGLPGALPLLNKEAVRLTVELGQALNGTIAETTFWARKNYFYPDLPKGYQISQSTTPLVEQARIEIDGVKHNIQRIHLEEDAGKSVHQADQSASLVNFNRAGVPLMEMVTEPDFHSAEDAKRFCQEIQRIVRALGISDADMEKGQMRCEANISVAPTNPKSQIPNPKQTPNSKSQYSKLGTKVEVKNINSFRAVEKAIAYEYERQVEMLEKSEKVVHETRTWDSVGNQTVAMRSKETSADYRYFPEPDLPRVKIEVGAAKIHKLPEAQRNELVDLGVNQGLAKIIVDKGWSEDLLTLIARDKNLIREAATAFTDYPKFAELSADTQEQLLNLRRDKGWTKEAFTKMIAELASGRTLEQASAVGDFDLGAIIHEVIGANPAAVADFKSGKDAALNFLVGQIMAKTKGKANINEVRTELQEYFRKS